MAIKTLYAFDNSGKKIPVGNYDTSAFVTLSKDVTDWCSVSCGTYQPEGLEGVEIEFELGDSCTVTATYTGPSTMGFLNWQTPQGVILSTSNPYTFMVTESVSIVGHFGFT